MAITDYPARCFAVFIFAPFLIIRGIKYKDNILILLGILLFVYEIFCMIYSKPAVFNW